MLKNRFLSTTAFAILIVVVALLAFWALNGADAAPVTAAVQESAVVPGAQGDDVNIEGALAPDASPNTPTATSKYNDIALPLDVQSNWAASGIPFTARGLAQYIGVSSVVQVLRWSSVDQRYDSWFPGGNYGIVDGVFTTTPYPLKVGDMYRILINENDPSLNRLSLVGDVPAANSIEFTFAGAVSCKYNDISVPLNESTLSDAKLLADSMGGSGNVKQVLSWNASLQNYDSWFPASNYGIVNGAFTTTPFTVRIGYPYRLCLNAGASGVVWP